MHHIPVPVPRSRTFVGLSTGALNSSWFVISNMISWWISSRSCSIWVVSSVLVRGSGDCYYLIRGHVVLLRPVVGMVPASYGSQRGTRYDQMFLNAPFSTTYSCSDDERDVVSDCFLKHRLSASSPSFRAQTYDCCVSYPSSRSSTSMKSFAAASTTFLVVSVMLCAVILIAAGRQFPRLGIAS